MKKIYLFLLTLVIASCSSDDGYVVEEDVTLFVNHYKTTSVLNPTVFLIQEDAAIGSSDFKQTAFIQGFDFEQGSTYTLDVIKVTTKNPGTDATTVHYELSNIIDSQLAGPDEIFEVPISRFVNGIGYISWIIGNPDLGFILSREIDIDCAGLCNQLESVSRNELIATGIFKHGDDGNYILTELY